MDEDTEELEESKEEKFPKEIMISGQKMGKIVIPKSKNTIEELQDKYFKKGEK